MNRKQTVVLSFSILAVLALSCYAQLMFTDCVLLTCPPERSFEFEEIALVPEAFFPEGSVFYYSTSTDDAWIQGVIDYSGMAAYLRRDKGLAVYVVKRFRTQADAEIVFRRSYNFDIELDPVGNGAFQSELADEFIIRCGEMQLKGNGCEMIARYDEYYLSFNTSINEYMTLEQFLEIALYIDKQIAERLIDD